VDGPERYNIAADVCDKHPRDKLAMVWERFDGATREVAWGELQDLANQAAHVLRDHGVERGDRVAVVLPADARGGAIFFGTWKLGALRLRMSVLYGDEGDPPPRHDAEPRVLVTDAANAARFAGSASRCLVLDEGAGCWPGAAARLTTRHGGRTIPRSSTTRPGTTGLAKGIVHAHRYLLAHNEFELCHEVQGRRALPRHGGVGVGGGIAPLLGPVAAGRGCRSCSSARAASIRAASSTSSAATRSRTSSPPRPRCGR
jgi:acetyl-CoA synthetase